MDSELNWNERPSLVRRGGDSAAFELTPEPPEQRGEVPIQRRLIEPFAARDAADAQAFGKSQPEQAAVTRCQRVKRPRERLCQAVIPQLFALGFF